MPDVKKPMQKNARDPILGLGGLIFAFFCVFRHALACAGTRHGYFRWNQPIRFFNLQLNVLVRL